jgi:hypothetical protein
MLVESTMSAPDCGPAFASTSRMGTPSHLAVPSRSPPTSFETQVRVIEYSSRPRSSRSWNESVSSVSTMPTTERLQAAGSMEGTVRAVSTR